MPSPELHRGRLIDHVHLVVKDLRASRRFYGAVFEVLGIPLGADNPEVGFFWADELFVSSPDAKAPAGHSLSATGKPTGWVHLAFQAPDRGTVDRFHVAAVAAGGKDNGAPGVRPYHPGYYAAFVLDPDGNNIEVVHHGTANRSAPSVKITF
jgi:catechol 2,3-dioxygenase-like lactoylglutathione lyase family enzyme